MSKKLTQWIIRLVCCLGLLSINSLSVSAQEPSVMINSKEFVTKFDSNKGFTGAYPNGTLFTDDAVRNGFSFYPMLKVPDVISNIGWKHVGWQFDASGGLQFTAVYDPIPIYKTEDIRAVWDQVPDKQKNSFSDRWVTLRYEADTPGELDMSDAHSFDNYALATERAVGTTITYQIKFNDLNTTQAYGYTHPKVKAKPGYEFIGWKLYDESNQELPMDQPINVHAVAIAQYRQIVRTVEFISQYGLQNPKEHVIDGQTATQPIHPKADEKSDGHVFKGWYTDETYTTPFDFSQAIVKDTKVYAKWETTQPESKPEKTDQSSPNKPKVKENIISVSKKDKKTKSVKKLPKTGVESLVPLALTGSVLLVGGMGLTIKKED